MPVKRSSKYNVYSADELNQIEQNLIETQDPLLHAFVLSAHYGLRAGEACAVRWCDLDLEAGILHAQGTLRLGRSGFCFTHYLKTPASVQDVPLWPYDTELFRSLRRKREAAGFATVSLDHIPDPTTDITSLDPNAFVCWDSEGDILTPRVLRQQFPGILDTLGLRRGTWHDLRNSFREFQECMA